ncbi:DUF4436 family protein [Streptacidiphilus sp. P02-A3a]|uniref:DUF4436 family protein n=1 Tax=Streptacidiphilus sp. P02-A3a TaxID=2704468 RepID=UPI0015FB3992|nr:DUF4436 family protein [Streptacidiphilus sp. P02-A3a]QMU71805.1 DUF4436 domain-containing protein [Streptacidiphilus sp. P02-A3a]
MTGAGSGGRRGSRVGAARRWLGRLLCVLLVPALCTAGLLLYLNERDAHRTGHTVGDRSVADRVDVEVTVQKVDPLGQRAVLRVALVPRGSYAQGDSDLLSKDLVVRTLSPTTPILTLPAGVPVPAQDMAVGLYGGTVSDYPFDRYSADVGFAAVAGDRSVPLTLTLVDADPFFTLTARSGDESDGGVSLQERITRSRSSHFLAWFMMAAMWALALSVLGAGWIVVSQRRGLVWPALGWMAATLFALVGMRNAAPGSPPTGALMDYLAFFWAELLVALTLTAAAAQGFWHERRPPPTTD